MEIEIRNDDGTPATDFTGEVEIGMRLLGNSEPTLKLYHTFVASDNGKHTFLEVTLPQPGTYEFVDTAAASNTFPEIDVYRWCQTGEHYISDHCAPPLTIELLTPTQ